MSWLPRGCRCSGRLTFLACDVPGAVRVRPLRQTAFGARACAFRVLGGLRSDVRRRWDDVRWAPVTCTYATVTYGSVTWVAKRWPLAATTPYLMRRPFGASSDGFRTHSAMACARVIVTSPVRGRIHRRIGKRLWLMPSVGHGSGPPEVMSFHKPSRPTLGCDARDIRPWCNWQHAGLWCLFSRFES